jgi:hypothetical protein
MAEHTTDYLLRILSNKCRAHSVAELVDSIPCLLFAINEIDEISCFAGLEPAIVQRIV